PLVAHLHEHGMETVLLLAKALLVALLGVDLTVGNHRYVVHRGIAPWMPRAARCWSISRRVICLPTTPFRPRGAAGAAAAGLDSDRSLPGILAAGAAGAAGAGCTAGLG